MNWHHLAFNLCPAAIWILAMAGSLHAQPELKISTDFEGGSARVIEIDSANHKVHISPGGNSSHGWICWWHFRIDNAVIGKSLTIEVSASQEPTRNQGKLTPQPLAAGWCLPQQASISYDGTTWQRTAVGARVGNSIHYEITPEKPTFWLAWGPPFTPRDTTNLLARAVATISGAEEFKLARSRADRAVPGLRIGSKTDDEQKLPGVWIQARQHAWESGSSWVARGFVEWLIANSEAASWLKKNAEIVVVPIMDVDNVTTGNGGKEEDPRDHNRDWDDQPVFPEVKAAEQFLNKWSQEKRLDFFIDLHNPAPNDSKPFFFAGPPEFLSDRGRENRTLFLEVASKLIQGPLAVEPNPRLTGPSYHPLWRKISGQWVTDHGNDHTLAICLETSWNTPHSTTAGYQTVGQQLGETIAEYLKQRKK